MTKAFNTFQSTFVITLVFAMLAGLKYGFVEGQSGGLPPEEVDALREIASQMGIKDWNFNENPCVPGISSWNTPKKAERPQYNNSVICNCSNLGECHVERIDFTRNYLSGTIPHEWASTKLEYISLAVNRLSGTIPDYLGNISALRFLSLEHNMFNGIVPAALGKLVNLQNLSGHLHTSFNY
ncbi:putative leucine-rich repeat receptor-like serine/threonine-protein kinase At3g14840 [Apium graveolens]|uniref:putative leucine-rich repeat receptor-like serine/threonine-protein kinase At3g14840 n=1 Tax=Apium graveolens TaxID=4045 RepID=UPI003D7A863D